jgi:hypothetical protein
MNMENAAVNQKSSCKYFASLVWHQFKLPKKKTEGESEK